MVNNRRRKATEILQLHGLDALLVTDMTNVRYLTGFTGSDGALILTADAAWFLCDSRYTTQAGAQVDVPVIEYKKKLEGLVARLSDLALRRVGFESATVTCAEFRQLETLAGEAFTWVAVDDLSSLRLLKDDREIALLEQATALSARAFGEIEQLIVPGAIESDIALALEIAIRKQGGDGKSFDFIVASGERGALPHGVASDRELCDHELVTIDFGGTYQGYFADETVTVALGEPSAELMRLHETVLEAHDRAIAAVKPGVLLQEIDATARDFINAAGYGDYFGHGLGHGVGLEVHEAPRVSPLSKGLTQVGMVFTVEPGIYIPGLGGVRIEDMVVVTETGCRILTRLPKHFRRMN